VRETAPAKINLALHVTGRRSDGYHLLDSLVVFTRFGDLIEVESADTDSFSVDGPLAQDVPTDAGNLVLKARDALRQALPSPSWGGSPAGRVGGIGPAVAIRLTKNLPIASGIGGGSSDAAATLKALNRLWNAGLSEAQLAAIALPLGADLPMCLTAKPLIARGIGDDLTPVANVPAIPLVLINPNAPVATASVFAALENRDNTPLPPLPRSFDFHGLRNWLDTTRNDLQAPALKVEPAVGQVIRALDKADSGFTRMSGSGATCFGLFETNNVAKRAAASIRQSHPGWWVATTRAIASEETT